MSGHIERLHVSLINIAERKFNSDDLLGRPQLMAEELERVKATFNRQANAPPAQDRILKAISAFLEAKSLENAEQARLIAWGLAVSHFQDKPILEMEEPFTRFIKEVWEFWGKEEVSSKAWRGLLSSYFRYTGPCTENKTGLSNWHELRKFLQTTFQAVLDERKQKPEWMVVLSENSNLLDREPCADYAAAVLEGNTNEVERIREVLGIPETSWFLAELVRAQIELACSYEEGRFKRYLPRLCETLRQTPLYSNEGLAELLQRYSRCGDTSEHDDLSRLSIEKWHNPKLPSSTMWGLVPQDVKAMVLKWLISRDLRIFFDLFASDHDADQDQRRLAFWMRYLDQIQDAYFALGNHAYNSQDEDYLEVRKRNEGRLSRLDRGGSPNNNAFIMLVGRYAIVEFGTKGNACFCFDLDSLPFSLGDTFLVGDKSQLKKQDHHGCKDRLLHKDGLHGFEHWEDEFEERLRVLGIGPDSPVVPDHAKRSRSSTGRRNQTLRRSAQRADHKPIAFEMAELIDFAKFHGLQVTDLRHRGGNLWVEPHKQSGQVHSRLTQWGFKLKEGRGWWFQNKS